jgi:hypothetical protein
MNLEKNQDKSSYGGARKGAGRKAGAATTKTREIANNAASSGLTPLEYMLSVMRNEDAEPRERMGAAMGAAPYIHPKLASIEHSGPDGGAIPVASRIELVALK